MKWITRVTKRLILPLLWLFACNSCVTHQTASAPGYYVVNPDGSRTFMQGTYTCPTGYTCTVQAPTTTYVEPSPYIWTPIFFSLGYFFGYHADSRHYYARPRPPYRPHGTYWRGRR